MSNSVLPHRQQPNRLPHPWDSPGKNTGVGCHFLLQCMKVKSESEVAQSCPTLCDTMDCSLPSCTIHGIFQARILEWVAISFSLIKAMPNNAQSTAQLHSSHTLVIYHTIALISHASKVMLKILQARPQQYMNHELPDVQAGFRKGRGTRDQIANI